MRSSITQSSTCLPVRSGAILILVALAFAVGCSDNHPLAPELPPPSPTPTETVLVTIATTGANPDSDGYLLTLHSEVDIPVDSLVQTNSSVRLTNLSFTTPHWLTLTGIAPNCTSDSSYKRIGDRLPGNGVVVPMNFTITCVGSSVPPNSVGTRLLFVRRGEIYRTTLGSSSVTALTTGEEPTWSPDGNRIAFMRAGNIYVMDQDGARERLVATGSLDSTRMYYDNGMAPAWSPDGSRLALYSDSTIVIIAVDSAAVLKQLATPTLGFAASPTWSPDGKRIVFTSGSYDYEYGESLQVLVGDVDASGLSISNYKTLSADGKTAQPAWSPDGSSIAAVICGENADSTCAGDGHIAVMNPDGSQTRNLVSSRGFSRPAWSPDGTAIAYANTCSDYNCPSAILYVSTDGKQNGVLINDAHSPSWHR
ncbi:MAG: DPP IV N-terminal domain-containing protein [Bryocella sp.]